MFMIGDRVTINQQYKAYRVCMCNYCEALRDGAEGIVIEVFPQSVKVEVITIDGKSMGVYAFNTEGLILLYNKEPDWEV